MLNTDNNLILVKGEDKTETIRSIHFDTVNSRVFITFISNEKSYSYNVSDVKLYKSPKIVVLNDSKIVLNNNELLSDVKELRFFDSYCRITYNTGRRKLTLSSNIKIIESVLNSSKANSRFEYLKQLAACTGIKVAGNNILLSHYQKINFIREDSALATFLCGKYLKVDDDNNSSVIYPFRFNLSQKRAIENALNSHISVIEGPPGTGKTQTILNIIANLVMRGKSVAVVSNNNSALTNILEKLKKQGVDFIVAFLGSATNRKVFIESQTSFFPDMSEWQRCKDEVLPLRKEVDTLNQKFVHQNELSAVTAELDMLEKEYAHFKDYYKKISVSAENDIPRFSKNLSAAKIIDFIAEYEFLFFNKKRLGFFRKIFLKLAYGLKNFRFCGQAVSLVDAYCRNLYYELRLNELKERETELKNELATFDFDVKMEDCTAASMRIFKAYLAEKYGTLQQRKHYSIIDLWKDSQNFIEDYPVVLSTTYSLRESLSNKFVYDYIIIDEASQVDLATGALALSCAKRAVIVGDLKQLPDVVNQEQKYVTDQIFEQYRLPEAYRYSDHSLLRSIIDLFPNIPRVLLKEHYRCHPEIIGFCNHRFYNDELIILTKPKNERQPFVVYKTVAGNHERDHINYRQIDVITKEVFPKQKLSVLDGTVGIVTPYRKQADELKRVFMHTTVKADTVDKFQGQEKSIMIFSTVDNEIGRFVSDPNRLNVAISRAIDQFIIVTDGNNNDETSPIHDLIGYIQYNNHEIINSEIYSVFDYLYKSYANAREKILKKYGRVSDIESENLMYFVIREVLTFEDYTKYDVVLHIPLRMILSDFQKLNERELAFATNHLSHVDFLIYSKLTHQPVLVVEVDGFAYHNDEKQKERDRLKDEILRKYGIHILRFSTIGSEEKKRLISMLRRLG